jgi:hypothetical protein
MPGHLEAACKNAFTFHENTVTLSNPAAVPAPTVGAPGFALILGSAGLSGGGGAASELLAIAQSRQLLSDISQRDAK